MNCITSSQRWAPAFLCAIVHASVKRKKSESARRKTSAKKAKALSAKEKKCEFGSAIPTKKPS